MSVASALGWSLPELQSRADALLPGQYQSQQGLPNPRSMGSAPLQYDANQRVAWDQIWTHYCDLALAGGPPHRGSLLEAPTITEVEYEPAGYHLVCGELIRGITLAAKLAAQPGSAPGWLAVTCADEPMAAWMHRAVMAENVFVRRRGNAIEVPAAPTFRLAKEVKNVVVALAKTSHYWSYHLNAEEKTRAAAVLQASEASLIEPVARPEALDDAEFYRTSVAETARQWHQATGLETRAGSALGWIGVRLRDEITAAWFVRHAIASDLLARREEEYVYLPVPSRQATPTIKRVTERWLQLVQYDRESRASSLPSPMA